MVSEDEIPDQSSPRTMGISNRRSGPATIGKIDGIKEKVWGYIHNPNGIVYSGDA